MKGEEERIRETERLHPKRESRETKKKRTQIGDNLREKEITYEKKPERIH